MKNTIDWFKKNIRLSIIIYILVVTAMLLISLIGYTILIRHQSKQIYTNISHTVKSFSINVQNKLKSDMLPVERMAKRWAARGGIPKAEWMLDAKNYVHDNPSYQAIEWIDPSYHVRWIVPRKGNEKALNLNINFEKKRKVAFDHSRDNNETVITKIITLKQGGKGFLIVIPINKDKTFKGFILAVFRIKKFLSPLINESIYKYYNIYLYENNSLVFSNLPYDNLDLKYTINNNIDIKQVHWRIDFIPDKQYIHSLKSNIPFLFLFIGILISILIASIFYFLNLAKTKSIKLQNNVQIQELIYNSVRSISEATSFKDAIKNLLQSICETMCWPIGHAFKFDSDKQLLTCSGIWFTTSTKNEDFSEFIKKTKETDLKKGVDLPGRVWQDGILVWIDDIQTDADFPRAKLYQQTHLHNAFAFPIFAKGKQINLVAEFFSSTSTKKDKTFLRSLNILSIQINKVLYQFTIEEETNQKLQYQANYDYLTALHNRAAFERTLNEEFARAHRFNNRFALLFIDIDDFKHINDNLGHHTGDIVLKEVADRLQQCLRETDFLARVGGDEFSIIFQDIESTNEAGIIAEKIQQTLATSVSISRQNVIISVSIGVACYPTAGNTASELLKHADIAMYQAKENGKKQWQYYTPSLNEQFSRQIQLQNSLQNALIDNEFYFLYQPQYNVVEDKIIGVEALLRWQHPSLGVISPKEFIPIAENMRLIDTIGFWILEQACLQCQCWLKKYPRLNLAFELAINLSSQQLFDQKIFLKLSQLIKRYHFNPHNLVIELTETAIMSKEIMIENLQEITDLGIRIAIDDFGTGYSSLNYLRQLPVHIVKIDKSFIDDIPENENANKVVKAIITMVKSLGLDIIAEGVETKEQQQFLIEHGCHIMQGFYMATPMSVEEINKLLDDEK